MQFGRNHRFGTLAAGDPEADVDTLHARLAEDLRRLTRKQGLRPQVIIVSGDLAEWGLASEFKDAFEFLARLATGLDIPRRNVVVVPGNHDVNRKLCESYFSECDGDEKEPVAPYARKWEPYRKQFDEFFAGEGIEFTTEQPWSMWELDELRLVVAGLNSTMHESHRDEDHYGWVGERQLRWFEERLEPYAERGWLRIGVVHHNLSRGATDDDENLRDVGDLQARLGSSINLLLHGHTHEGKTAWLHRGIPVLSTGSAALDASARPPEVPNQYHPPGSGRALGTPLPAAKEVLGGRHRRIRRREHVACRRPRTVRRGACDVRSGVRDDPRSARPLTRREVRPGPGS